MVIVDVESTLTIVIIIIIIIIINYLFKVGVVCSYMLINANHN